MSANIDLLLEKLPAGSLAHQLVSRLKNSEQGSWDAVLDEFLRSRIEEKVQELKNAEDQKS